MPGTYLSSSNVSWNPQSEVDLAFAAEQGLMEESHYLELKGVIPKPSKASNKELARDLAQFSIDGGNLLVGIAEQEGQPQLTPVPLAGLCERIEQVASMGVDPPLFVSCREIRSEVDTASGYVLVQIPSSSTAPHMVDGVYYGRGDKTRTRLSDAEVERHHRARTNSAKEVSDLLDAYASRDPVPLDLRTQAHLYVVAAPVTPRPEMLLGLFDGSSAHARVQELIHAAGPIPGVPDQDQLPPRLSYATSFETRVDGVALTSGLGGDGTRSYQPGVSERVSDILEVELTEDGLVRIFNSRLSDEVQGTQRILGPTLPQMVRQAVNLAGLVASATGYGGGWNLGVLATGIAGVQLWPTSNSFWEPPGYPRDRDTYRRTTSAHSSEIQQQPGSVTNRLVGQYLRVLKISTDPRITPLVS